MAVLQDIDPYDSVDCSGKEKDIRSVASIQVVFFPSIFEVHFSCTRYLFSLFLVIFEHSDLNLLEFISSSVHNTGLPE